MKRVWLATFLAMALLTRGDDRLPITLINYSPLPVHATAVAFDEKLASGPVRVRRADNAAEVALARGVEDGRAVLRLLVSLPPASRLDLVAKPAERWSESQLVKAKSEPPAAILKPLVGDYRPEYLFVLQQAFDLYHTYEEKIQACDQEPVRSVSDLPDRVDLSRQPILVRKEDARPSLCLVGPATLPKPPPWFRPCPTAKLEARIS